MTTIDQKYWDSLTKTEQDLLIKAVSTSNVLMGRPSFQEFCAVKNNIVTMDKKIFRLTKATYFCIGVFVGVVIGVVVAISVV